MVNTEKLSKYIGKAGTTWEEIVQDCGGFPDDMQRFADKFEDKAKAEDVILLASKARIPSYQIGLVFFAPEEYGHEAHPHLVELRDGDAMAEIYAGLSVKSRTKLLSLAFKLQEAEAKEAEING